MTLFLDKPPQNENLERSILAGCILDNDMRADAIYALHHGDFYSTEHGTIFLCIVDLEKNKDPVDMPSILLKSKELKLKLTGPVLSSIVDEPIPSNMDFYCQKLRLYTIRRSGIMLASKYIGKLQNDDATSDTLFDYQKAVLQLDCDVGNKKTYSDIRDLIEAGEDRHSELYKQKRNITGIPTGFKFLDKQTCGLQPGDIIIIAARPSMGKSALAKDLSVNMAKEGYPNITFSLEMAKEQLYDRMLASESGIDSTKFRNGFFTTEEWEERNRAAGRLYGLKIFIEDQSYKHTDIYRKIRLAWKLDGIKCVIIDYLQLMEGDRTQKKNYEFGDITKSLKHLAKELNIPIIVLAQLNRMLETRDNKRPKLSDIKDSGNIEQDADVVMFIYRHEVYLKEKTQGNDLFDKWHGRAELIIAKQRMGPVGTIPLTWLEKTTTFKDYAL